MKDILRIPKGIIPCHAEGHYCIDLTDPITGKVTNRINGKNHIFEDSLFSQVDGSNWQAAVSAVILEMTDSTDDIDPEMPFLFGQTVGYGKPSTAGSGNYRGAYNAANQILALTSPESSLWKFQYDFTTAQANGTIGTIGLTHQHTGYKKIPFAGYCSSSNLAINGRKTCDGRYSYSCSNAGIITKYDNYLATSTTINVSSVVGTTNFKNTGYAPATGYYYIYVYDSTAANRKMYVFTDNTFSTLVTSYGVSNLSITSEYPMYIYGDYAFWLDNSNVNSENFVNNSAVTVQTFSSYSYVNYIEDSANGSYANHSYLCGSMAYDKYIITYSNATYSTYTGIIYDMSARKLLGYITNASGSSNNYPTVRYPVGTTHFMPAETIANGRMYHNCAIAAKKLDAPVTKTTANGLTVTYELEVFW